MVLLFMVINYTAKLHLLFSFITFPRCPMYEHPFSVYEYEAPFMHLSLFNSHFSLGATTFLSTWLWFHTSKQILLHINSTLSKGKLTELLYITVPTTILKLPHDMNKYLFCFYWNYSCHLCTMPLRLLVQNCIVWVTVPCIHLHLCNTLRFSFAKYRLRLGSVVYVF